jgi:hypothetical protein
LPPADEPQGGLCTTNKTYNNNDPVTGAPLVMPGTGVNNVPPVPATQIKETWVGDIDMYWR